MSLLVALAIVVLLVFCSVVVNMSIFHRSELFFYLSRANLWKTVRYLYPLSIAMMCAKFLTYTSYGLIPVSLTHTVKALQPFFNVLLVFVWTRESVDLSTFLSLIPIVFGVIYASVNEIEYIFFRVVSILDLTGRASSARFYPLLSVFGRASTSRCSCTWAWSATTFSLRISLPCRSISATVCSVAAFCCRQWSSSRCVARPISSFAGITFLSAPFCSISALFLHTE